MKSINQLCINFPLNINWQKYLQMCDNIMLSFYRQRLMVHFFNLFFVFYFIDFVIKKCKSNKKNVGMREWYVKNCLTHKNLIEIKLCTYLNVKFISIYKVTYLDGKTYITTTQTLVWNCNRHNFFSFYIPLWYKI